MHNGELFSIVLLAAGVTVLSIVDTHIIGLITNVFVHFIQIYSGSSIYSNVPVIGATICYTLKLVSHHQTACLYYYKATTCA